MGTAQAGTRHLDDEDPWGQAQRLEGIDVRDRRRSGRGAVAVSVALVASMLAGCQPAHDDPAEVLRAGACTRLGYLNAAVEALSDPTPVAVGQHEARLDGALRMVREDAALGLELTRSSYADDLGSFHEQVELAIFSENAGHQGEPVGPDWDGIWRTGAAHAEAWECAPWVRH